MSKIKLLVVDNSSVMRHMITNIVNERETLGVIGTASNGKDALLKSEALNPDVIVMDLHMGEYDGIYALKEIMKTKTPKPIILLSSSENEHMESELEALNAGAFDCVNKPVNNRIKLREIADELYQKIEAAYQTDISVLVNRVPIGKNVSPHTFTEQLPYDIVLIGASTGGPAAIEKIVSNIPINLSTPIIIAQHMPSNFISSYAKRLERIGHKEVIIAQAGKIVERGKIYILPGDKNTVLVKKEGQVKFSIAVKKYPFYNHPSVDALFTSAVEIYEDKIIASLLTGMGKDGANGLKLIKKRGGLTIAQSQETCVVYGMPKSAVDQDAVNYSLNIEMIAPFIISALS